MIYKSNNKYRKILQINLKIKYNDKIILIPGGLGAYKIISSFNTILYVIIVCLKLSNC